MATDADKSTDTNQSRHSIGARKNPETEAAILDAAADLIAQKGIKGLGMEAVARKAKAGKATVYRWWPTRGALLLAVYQRKKPAMSYDDTGSLLGDLTRFADCLLDVWKGENGLFFKAIIAEAQADPDVAEKLKDYHAERLEALTAVVIRAQKRGEISTKENPKIRAEMLISLLWQRLLNNRLDEPVNEHIAMLANPHKS